METWVAADRGFDWKFFFLLFFFSPFPPPSPPSFSGSHHWPFARRHDSGKIKSWNLLGADDWGRERGLAKLFLSPPPPSSPSSFFFLQRPWAHRLLFLQRMGHG